jgi:hypothetical protein
MSQHFCMLWMVPLFTYAKFSLHRILVLHTSCLHMASTFSSLRFSVICSSFPFVLFRILCFKIITEILSSWFRSVLDSPLEVICGHVSEFTSHHFHFKLLSWHQRSTSNCCQSIKITVSLECNMGLESCHLSEFFECIWQGKVFAWIWGTEHTYHHHHCY